MIHVSSAKRIPVSAERLWRMISSSELRDFVVGTFVESVEVSGDGGPGSLITVTSKVGITLTERIDDIDDVEREFSYSVVDSGALNYAYYKATMRVQPCGQSDSLLSARCRFIAEDGKEEVTRDAWYASNSKKFDLIADYFKTKA